MTLSALLPYLLVGAGYLLRHYEIVSKLLSLVGIAVPSADPTGEPIVTPGSSPKPLPILSLANHPVLSDAVNAAINQAVKDALAGHLASVQDAIKTAAGAAVAAAVADLKSRS